MKNQNPTDEELRATSWDLVVVGRGYAGITNCVTRWRKGDLPSKTLIIGKRDPWLKYAKHDMGQYPALLALPGFDTDAQPTDYSEAEFLSSRRFAAQNRLQLRRLLAAHDLREIEGLIEAPLSYVNQKWIVQLAMQGRSVTVRTANVDLCSGPGPGRVFSPGSGNIYGPWAVGIRDSFEPQLLQELMDGVGYRARVAEAFMGVKEISGRVIVVGEGPLAASTVEHALRSGAKQVTWVGRSLEMISSFPPSLRYDGLINSAEDVRQCEGKLNALIDSGSRADTALLQTPMTPVDARLTIVLGCVSGVAPDYATLIPSGPCPLRVLSATEQFVYSAGHPLMQPFDMIVISASSQDSQAERLAAAHLLNSLPKSVSSRGLVPISRDAMLVGLEIPIGSLRVLGAASRNQAIVKRFSQGSPEDTAYENWHNSLCAQARMLKCAMGVTVGAATIAMANNYYSSTSPDLCAQTTRKIDFPLRAIRNTRPTPFSKGELAESSYEAFPRSS